MRSITVFPLDETGTPFPISFTPRIEHSFVNISGRRHFYFQRAGRFWTISETVVREALAATPIVGGE